MPADPDDYRAWIGVVRDAATAAAGIFMLVYATALEPSPNPYVIGGGLAALGVPAALRLDLKKKAGDGS